MNRYIYIDVKISTPGFLPYYTSHSILSVNMINSNNLDSINDNKSNV